MASVRGGPPCEDHLLCSICLDVFAQPVSTPCGHNYCKPCITAYWASSGQAQCPLCKERFGTQPKLQVNTEFRDMVEHLHKKRSELEVGVPAKPGEVPCDICVQPKARAEKTCLVCLASYCRPHLEPHQRVATFQQHRLAEPVANLEDRVCKKHNKVCELFCRVDEVCVCLMCLSDDHAQHQAVPLEQAFGEKKQQLEKVATELKAMESSKSRVVKKCKYSIRKNNWKLKKQIADIDEAFSALVASLLQSQEQLIEEIEEKHREDKKRSEDHLAELRQEVAQLKKSSAEVEKLLQTEDQHHLLRSWPSLSYRAHFEDAVDPPSPSSPRPGQTPFRQGYGTMVTKAVSHMKKTLADHMEALIQEVRVRDGGEAADAGEVAHGGEAADGDEAVDGEPSPSQGDFGEDPPTPSENDLSMIQLCSSVDVTFNARTANPLLAVYANGKCLGNSQHRQLLYSKQFSRQPCVLGREGFSSGDFYFQVRVGWSTGWLVGVVRESVDWNFSEGPFPEQGGWTVCGFFDESWEYCFANTRACETLHVRPQTVGVFVSYEKGEVFFYDVEARTRFLSYTNCVFNEPAPMVKSLLYSLAGTSVGKTKLYPIFGLFGRGGSESLTIAPVGSEV